MSWKRKKELWARQDAERKHLDRLEEIPTLAKEYSVENSVKMTPAEVALGKILRELKQKYPDMQIVPQKPLRENERSETFYIADYYIKRPYHIVVEADGGYHKNQVAYDKKRDKTMTKHGVRVLRLANREILENPDKARIKIEVALFVRKPQENSND